MLLFDLFYCLPDGSVEHYKLNQKLPLQMRLIKVIDCKKATKDRVEYELPRKK